MVIKNHPIDEEWKQLFLHAMYDVSTALGGIDSTLSEINEKLGEIAEK